MDNVLVYHTRSRQEHGREHAGPVLAHAAMEYQRVIVPVGNQLQRVHQPLAEFRPADTVQIKLPQIGRIAEQFCFLLYVVRRSRAEGYVVMPRAHFIAEADFPLLGQLSRCPKVYDRPGADVLFESRNIRLAHGLQCPASEEPPPCHGAPVPCPVSAEVSEIRRGFKVDVSWIRLAHLASTPDRPYPAARLGRPAAA